MIIEDIACQHYTVPFRVPFTTSHGLAQHREGLLLKVQTDEGIIGYGEAVSLPSFGTATLEELERHLSTITARLQQTDISNAMPVIDELAADTAYAPVRFAFDAALLDIHSEHAGLPISQYLTRDAAESVPLNATISEMDARGAASVACYAATAGYRAIKMKIGAYADPAGEIERVAAVRSAIGPNVELRLDVNGAWSSENAIEFARMLEPYDIGYIEQPLPASDIGAMARLRKQIEIPLAADEAATTRGAIEELIEAEAVDVIVIKPAVVGGITVARELIELASSSGMRVVVTTALETGVGITAALHLAATLPHPVLPCGLATGALLETDLLSESPVIEGGRMFVPRATGLGAEPLASIWTA